MLSDLAGQLMVRGHESNVIQMAADGGANVPFLNKPWDEALEEFRARGVMKPNELSRLLGDYAQRTDKARQLMLGQIQTFVRAELERSIRDGGTMRDFAKRIEDGDASLGITADDPAYLNMVFRTNVQSAYGAGRYRAMTDPDVMDARPYAEYRTVGDARVRPEHAALDKTVWALESDKWQRIAPPNSYNCFPGSTLVQGRFSTAVRALYTGQLVKLTTQSGRRLSVTPNHPLLTAEGFSPASGIRNGQHVLCYDNGIEASVVGQVNPEDAPVTIEQVFNALAVRHSPNTVHWLRPTADDFHGDAQFFNSDVNVVSADMELLLTLEPQSAQHKRDGILGPALVRGIAKDGSGATGNLIVAADSASACAPSATALALNSRPVLFEQRPFQQLSVGPAADLDASRYESAMNRAPTDAEFIAQLLERGSGRVFLDEVVSVEMQLFHGYVYDLESHGRGWLVADGIFTSNCRCSMVTLTREEARGRDIQSDVPAGYKPTPGFDGPPIAKVDAKTAPLPPERKQQVQVPEQLEPKPTQTQDEEAARQERMRQRKEQLDRVKAEQAQRNAEYEELQKFKPQQTKKVEPKKLESAVAKRLAAVAPNNTASPKAAAQLDKTRDVVKKQLDKAVPGLKPRVFHEPDANAPSGYKKVAGRDTRLLVSDTEKEVGKGVNAYASFDGAIHIHPDVLSRAQQGDKDAVRTIMHEVIHQHGPFTPLSIAKPRGRVVEEVATETLARHLSGASMGSYQQTIDEVLVAIVEVSDGLLDYERAQQRLLSAAIHYRKQPQTDDADELVSYLVDGMGLPARMKAGLISKLRRMKL